MSEIASARLHEERITPLERSIAPAVQHQGRIPSEQARRIDSRPELAAERRCFCIVPVAYHDGIMNIGGPQGAMAGSGFIVRPASWNADRERLRAIRRAVFIEEQGVPEELEWDGLDEHCRHALALAAGDVVVGTGRLTPDARIGRMAVARQWRGRGVGSSILQALLEDARTAGYAAVTLHAQVHALPFYGRHGFAVHGPVFLEAGIPHRAMTIQLERA